MIFIVAKVFKNRCFVFLEKDSIQAKRYSYDPNVRHFEMVFD